MDGKIMRRRRSVKDMDERQRKAVMARVRGGQPRKGGEKYPNSPWHKRFDNDVYTLNFDLDDDKRQGIHLDIEFKDKTILRHFHGKIKGSVKIQRLAEQSLKDAIKAGLEANGIPIYEIEILFSNNRFDPVEERFDTLLKRRIKKEILNTIYINFTENE